LWWHIILSGGRHDIVGAGTGGSVWDFVLRVCVVSLCVSGSRSRKLDWMNCLSLEDIVRFNVVEDESKQHATLIDVG
jgi:hypothetical protein